MSRFEDGQTVKLQGFTAADKEKFGEDLNGALGRVLGKPLHCIGCGGDAYIVRLPKGAANICEEYLTESGVEVDDDTLIQADDERIASKIAAAQFLDVLSSTMTPKAKPVEAKQVRAEVSRPDQLIDKSWPGSVYLFLGVLLAKLGLPDVTITRADLEQIAAEKTARGVSVRNNSAGDLRITVSGEREAAQIETLLKTPAAGHA